MIGLRRWAGPAQAAAGVIMFGFVSQGVAAVSGGSPCPLYRLTSLPCPGCGGSRALMALAHGDVGLALSYNAVGVLLVLVGVVLWSRWVYETARHRPVTRISNTMALVLGVVIVGWGVFRLLPIYPGIQL